jgi:uncharacterized protein (DUF1810 family)
LKSEGEWPGTWSGHCDAGLHKGNAQLNVHHQVRDDERWDLDRFVRAQDAGGTFKLVLSELRGHRKSSHWMWFIFPQISGLGRSATARRFAISSLEEARAYLMHRILEPRLLECVGLVLAAPVQSPQELLGEIDAIKLRSSMTLFMRAAPHERLFALVLDRFFRGEPDGATDDLLVRSAL